MRGEWLKRMRDKLAHRATWIKITWLASLFFSGGGGGGRKRRKEWYFAMLPRRSAVNRREARIDRATSKKTHLDFVTWTDKPWVFIRGRDNCVSCQTLAHVTCSNNPALHTSDAEKYTPVIIVQSTCYLSIKTSCVRDGAVTRKLSSSLSPDRNEIARWLAVGK